MRATRLIAWTFAAALAGTAPAVLAAPVDLTTLTYNGSAGVVGTDLQLTQNLESQAGSAYISTPFAISASSSFTATFAFSLENIDIAAGFGMADGITFVLQNAGTGSAALGSGGGSVGYGGITPSVAVALRSFPISCNSGLTACLEIDQGGAMDGPNQIVDLLGDQLDVIVTGTVTVSYAGGILSVSGSDDNGNIYALNSAVDLDALGGQAYIGFTGGTGSGTADQRITSFDLQIPEPGTMGLLAVGLTGLWAARRRREHLRAA